MARITSSACCILRTQSRREPKTKLYVAELRFRAVMEPVVAAISQ
ncbi:MULTISPECIES: hypothetical protein [unclassified Rhizobium]|nr:MULTISPECIES: hypothetical protein [unclassified Rhizobium]MBB3397206.1 hypothetical protein [Rhizobium sp. BK060]MBB4168676.1 hypothetical protein [Rhizobium sp. BK538]